MTKNLLEIQGTDGNLFYTAFSCAPIAMALLDQYGYFIKVNSSFCDFLGYEEKELLNLDFKVITHPNDLFADRELNRKLIKGEISTFQLEKHFMHKNGYTKCGLLTVSYVQLDNKPYMISQVVDITVMKKTEIKLNRLQFLMNETLDGRSEREFETMNLRQDGRQLTTDISMSPIYDNREVVTHLTRGVRDNSERKKLGKLMIQSEKLPVTGQLCAAFAHEIRNSITAIKGFIKLLQNAEEKQFYFEILESEVSRIELMVSELLSSAKPQKSVVKYVPLNTIMDQVISLMRAEANENGIEIIKHVNTDGTGILGDANQLKQVFINFIKNAFDAMPQGGSLTVEISKYDKMLQICFKDTGCGIPKDVLLKIGQPFFTTKKNGTGIGFMVSKRIIEDHNGRILISSQEQKGTAIKVYLPVVTNQSV